MKKTYYQKKKEEKERAKKLEERQKLSIKVDIAQTEHDTEMAVLGSILLQSNCFDEIIDLFYPDLFQDEKHQNLATLLLQMYNNGEKIDLLTVSAKKPSLTPFQLTKLTQRVNSSANIRYHVAILTERSIRTVQRKFADELIHLVYETHKTPDQIQKFIESKSIEIIQIETRIKSPETIKSQVEGAVNESLNEEAAKGLFTGFNAVDASTNGLQKADLVILAARPGQGKTAAALNMGLHAALEEKKNTAIFSLEMSANQLIKRLLSKVGNVSGTKIKKGKLNSQDQERFLNAADVVSTLPLYIDDTPSFSCNEFRKKAYMINHKCKQDTGKPLDFIIVDYLQLMNASINKSGGTEAETAEISRTLKLVAKELNVPVLALSQLSRAVEGRTDKMPTLSDLRYSGAIEQDADLVIFTYRPETYGQTEFADGGSTKNVACFSIAKNRNGELKEFDMLAFMEIMTYKNF